MALVPKHPSTSVATRAVGFLDQRLEPVEDRQGAVADLIEDGLRDDQVSSECGRLEQVYLSQDDVGIEDEIMGIRKQPMAQPSGLAEKHHLPALGGGAGVRIRVIGDGGDGLVEIEGQSAAVWAFGTAAGDVESQVMLPEHFLDFSSGGLAQVLFLGHALGRARDRRLEDGDGRVGWESHLEKIFVDSEDAKN